MNVSARRLAPPVIRAWRNLIPCMMAGALFLATMAAFWPVHHHEFLHFDDDINIFLNPHLGELDGLLVNWMFTDYHYMRRYVPAAWAGFSIIYQLYGLNPKGYHYASILLHGLNVLLLVGICREIMEKFCPKPADSIWAGCSAALAAAWWAWQPMRVETVAWASGYMYIQAIFFLLISFYFYIVRVEGGQFGRTKLWLSALFYLLSIATYPLALTYPAVLMVLEAVRFQRNSGLGWQTQRQKMGLSLAKIIVWFGLPAAVFAALTVHAAKSNPAEWGSPAIFKTLGYTARLGRAAYAWGYYLWKPWWPFDGKPVPDAIHDPAWYQGNFPLCIVALALMGWLCFAARSSRRSGVWAIGATYLIVLVPVSGLTEKVYFASDRYSYLPSLSLAVGFSVALAACRPPPLRQTAAFASILLLSGLFVMARRQLPAWENSRVFFETALQRLSPANDERSRVYLMQVNTLRVEGHYAEARAACARGLKEFPAYKLLQEEQQKIAETAAAEEARARILGLKAPACQLTDVHLSIALEKISHGEWRDAADHLRAALKATPDYYPARIKLAEVLTLLGRPDEALACYLQTLAVSDGHIPDTERAKFLSMLAGASTFNGESRLAHIAFKRASELCEKKTR